MSQVLLAQRAYAASNTQLGAISSAARIARDKSRDAASAQLQTVGLSKPAGQSFAQLLAQLTSPKDR